MDDRELAIPEEWSAEQARFLLDAVLWIGQAIRDAYDRRLAELYRPELQWTCPHCGRPEPEAEWSRDDTPPPREASAGEAGEMGVVDDDDTPW